AKTKEFPERWRFESPDTITADVLSASTETNPWMRGITLKKPKANGAGPMNLTDEPQFADGKFPTSSGKVELYSQSLADRGYDPLPGRFRDDFDDGGAFGDPQLALHLVTGAAHHFVSSSLA